MTQPLRKKPILEKETDPNQTLEKNIDLDPSLEKDTDLDPSLEIETDPEAFLRERNRFGPTPRGRNRS